MLYMHKIVCMNLIFIKRLNEVSHGNNFCDDLWKLNKGSLVIALDKKLKSNLYVIQASIFNDGVNLVKKQNSLELWYRKLSYINANGLKTRVKKNASFGLNNASLKKCSHCFVKIQYPVSFKTN